MQHVVSIKIFNEIFYALYFSHSVFKIQCVLYIYSASQPVLHGHMVWATGPGILFHRIQTPLPGPGQTSPEPAPRPKGAKRAAV